MSTHDGGIGDAPIEEDYIVVMRSIAEALDELFNGSERPKRTGFVLMVFNFGEGGRCNYVSNADRTDVLATLKDQVARFEGRAVDQAGHG